MSVGVLLRINWSRFDTGYFVMSSVQVTNQLPHSDNLLAAFFYYFFCATYVVSVRTASHGCAMQRLQRRKVALESNCRCS
jgi:hypothetical protein